jgi:hypothetical protein
MGKIGARLPGIIEIDEAIVWIIAREDGQGCYFCFTLTLPGGTEI